MTALGDQIKMPVTRNQGYFAILSEKGNLLAYPRNPTKAKALASYRDMPTLNAIWEEMQKDDAGLSSERQADFFTLLETAQQNQQTLSTRE